MDSIVNDLRPYNESIQMVRILEVRNLYFTMEFGGRAELVSQYSSEIRDEDVGIDSGVPEEGESGSK